MIIYHRGNIASILAIAFKGNAPYPMLMEAQAHELQTLIHAHGKSRVLSAFDVSAPQEGIALQVNCRLDELGVTEQSLAELHAK